MADNETQLNANGSMLSAFMLDAGLKFADSTDETFDCIYDSPPILGGIRIEATPSVPSNEVWIVGKNGGTIKIVNLYRGEE